MGEIETLEWVAVGIGLGLLTIAFTLHVVTSRKRKNGNNKRI